MDLVVSDVFILRHTIYTDFYKYFCTCIAGKSNIYILDHSLHRIIHMFKGMAGTLS